jgi:hypothetical protein
MTPIDLFLDSVKYLWIPMLVGAYRVYKSEQDKQDYKIEKLETKVSYQMTKEDVMEVVSNATKLLSAEIKLDLQKIDNGVHQIKNQNCSKDAVSMQLIEVIERLSNKIDNISKNEK